VDDFGLEWAGQRQVQRLGQGVVRGGLRDELAHRRSYRIRGSTQARAMSESSVPTMTSVPTTRMNQPARQVSFAPRAFSRSGPVNGSERTTPMIVPLETRSPSWKPRSETSGLTATRTGYSQTSLLSATPPARAEVTYGLGSSSSRLARMTRAM